MLAKDNVTVGVEWRSGSGRPGQGCHPGRPPRANSPVEHGEAFALGFMRHGNPVLIRGLFAVFLLQRQIGFERIPGFEDTDRPVGRAVNLEPVDVHKIPVFTPLRLDFPHPVFVHVCRMLPDR